MLTKLRMVMMLTMKLRMIMKKTLKLGMLMIMIVEMRMLMKVRMLVKVKMLLKMMVNLKIPMLKMFYPNHIQQVTASEPTKSSRCAKITFSPLMESTSLH